MAKSKSKFNNFDYIALGVVLLLVAAGLYLSLKPDYYHNRDVIIKVSEAPEYLIEGIEEGPVSSDYVTEVVDKWTEPERMVVTTDDGGVITTTHPYNENLYLHLEVNLVEDRGKLFYQNRQVLIGNNIGLVIDNFSVSGEVVSLR